MYIPKAGSDKLRPLGIPALEDKLVQAALATILFHFYFISEIIPTFFERRCGDGAYGEWQGIFGAGKGVFG